MKWRADCIGWRELSEGAERLMVVVTTPLFFTCQIFTAEAAVCFYFARRPVFGDFQSETVTAIRVLDDQTSCSMKRTRGGRIV